MPTPKLRITSKRTTTRLTDKATGNNAPDNPLRITGGVSHIITILSDFLRRKTDKIRFLLCVFDEFYFVKLINKNGQTHIFKHFKTIYSHIFEHFNEYLFPRFRGVHIISLHSVYLTQIPFACFPYANTFSQSLLNLKKVGGVEINL